MNRIYVFVLAFFLIFACNSEDANDCIQTSGAIIQKTFEVSSFEKIFVNRDIELIIKESQEYAVTVETGENLLNDVKVEIKGNQLILTDNNSCNYVRDYGITKIYVDAPNLTEIRTSSQYEISSDGTLNYDSLTLISEDFNVESEFTVGDFRLTINSNDLEIISSNLSFFYIDGIVEELFVGFYSGSGRFEGESLVVRYVSFYHRGTNDIIVNPQISLRGELRSTGDLISVNQPAIIEVERFYTGQLIFN